MKKLSALLLMLFLLTGCAFIAKETRVTQTQPLLNEELAWAQMYQDWSQKAAASRNFRAGFLAGATAPSAAEISGKTRMALDQIIKMGDPSAQEYQEGLFGGATLALYGSALQQGVAWVWNQLISLGIIRGGTI